jgi:threonine synthase
MWKAFDELDQSGWVKQGRQPKMIAVQAAGCAPVVRAYREGEQTCKMWQHAATFASGLRVPKPYGDAIILDILRASGGVALALSDEEILASILDWTRN